MWGSNCCRKVVCVLLKCGGMLEDGAWKRERETLLGVDWHEGKLSLTCGNEQPYMSIVLSPHAGGDTKNVERPWWLYPPYTMITDVCVSLSLSPHMSSCIFFSLLTFAKQTEQRILSRYLHSFFSISQVPVQLLLLVVRSLLRHCCSYSSSSLSNWSPFISRTISS